MEVSTITITNKAIEQKCDFCDAAAVYDGKTTFGPWAYMCRKHRILFGVSDSRLIHVLHDPTGMPKKKCTICGEEKPVDMFYKYTDRHGVDRYRPECKVCNLTKRQEKYKKQKGTTHDENES